MKFNPEKYSGILERALKVAPIRPENRHSMLNRTSKAEIGPEDGA
jgi:hypothetical protein